MNMKNGHGSHGVTNRVRKASTVLRILVVVNRLASIKNLSANDYLVRRNDYHE
ncbi:hypothetical protein AWB82_07200 [Caballeronia glebae]|uniref:Uncharacterized protein n=1 Tax=Caballeronia glebae TaxID=1777143 RepID=A0A158DUP7_9BURK|nr:hypothetical protein AWB82_07200 [Caballeronia glebae]